MSYDAARAEYEQQSSHKRGSYTAQRIAKKVNADVTPDTVKQPLQLGNGVSIIVHYDNKAGFAGKLFGILTVADGRKTSQIKVWDQALHDQVLLILGDRSRVVTIETKPSSKWGDSLTKIERIPNAALTGGDTSEPDSASTERSSKW